MYFLQSAEMNEIDIKKDDGDSDSLFHNEMGQGFATSVDDKENTSVFDEKKNASLNNVIAKDSTSMYNEKLKTLLYDEKESTSLCEEKAKTLTYDEKESTSVYDVKENKDIKPNIDVLSEESMLLTSEYDETKNTYIKPNIDVSSEESMLMSLNQIHGFTNNNASNETTIDIKDIKVEPTEVLAFEYKSEERGVVLPEQDLEVMETSYTDATNLKSDTELQQLQTTILRECVSNSSAEIGNGINTHTHISPAYSDQPISVKEEESGNGIVSSYFLYANANFEPSLLSHNIKKEVCDEGESGFLIQTSTDNPIPVLIHSNVDHINSDLQNDVAVEPLSNDDFVSDVDLNLDLKVEEALPIFFADTGDTLAEYGQDSTHITPEKRRRYKCEQCSKRFTRLLVLLKHMEIHRPTRKKIYKYKCKYCHKSFPTGSLQIKHKLVHTSRKKSSFKCSLCDKCFNSREHLTKHNKIHTRKMFRCQHCDRGFNELSTLITHIAYIHKEQKSFKCKKCDKCFKQKSSLKRHNITHSGKYPFTCKICGKGFITEKVYDSHMEEHTEDNMCQSPHSSKRFTHKGELMIRKESSTMHKPKSKESKNTIKFFKCQECMRVFSKKYKFENHRRVHTGEKPFKCEKCGKCFGQTGYLNKHMKAIHSKEEQFKCEECGIAFRLKGDLSIHYMRVHR